MRTRETVSEAFALIANEGFAIIPEVFAGAEITALSAALERSQLPRSRAGVRHMMRDAEIAAFAKHPKLVELAKLVLGTGAIPFRATLFDKSPASNWLVVWHQDTALPLQEKCDSVGWGPWSVKDGVTYAHAPASALEQVLALRVHLDDSTEQNGPLRVLPATHTLGVLSDDQLHELSQKKHAVDCVVERGGIVAMRPLVVHASSKSQSNAPRRVLHIEYAVATEISTELELAVA